MLNICNINNTLRTVGKGLGGRPTLKTSRLKIQLDSRCVESQGVFKVTNRAGGKNYQMVIQSDDV
jgi:hypothetical protein